MLVGVNVQPESVTAATLAKMNESKIRFFLTGSRYFGWERPDSDWDFFAESSVGVATTLRLLGFREDPAEGDETMEIIQKGDRVTSKTVGGDSRMVVGEVVEITGNIVRFLLDEGQSEFNVRPIFWRPLHKIRKL